MDIDRVNYKSENCLTLAWRYNHNLEVIKYLIECCAMNCESIAGVLFNTFDKFNALVSTVSKKYCNLNKLLVMGYREYGSNRMKQTVRQINCLRLDCTVRNLAGIANPYHGKFKTFAQYVDDLVTCSEPVFV